MKTEAIYKGATRPAMKFGVPLQPLVTLCGAGVLLALWAGALFSWWIALAMLVVLCPVLLWMRAITAVDDQRLRQLLMVMRLRRRDHNQRLWHARSYCPYEVRGGPHVWLG